jgi:hypothetical protein
MVPQQSSGETRLRSFAAGRTTTSARETTKQSTYKETFTY